MEIKDYLLSMHQSLKEKNLSEEGDFEEQLFLEEVASILIDCEEIEEAIPCHYRHPTLGMQVNGYYFNDVLDCLDLFIAKYDGENELKSLLKRDYESSFSRARKFFQRSAAGMHKSIEEASEGYDLAQEIYERAGDITQVRIYLLTDLVCKESQVLIDDTDGTQFSFHVCDINRIFRLDTSGAKREKIQINFPEEFNCTLKCLKMPDDNGIYCTYLAVMPGSLLASIYDKYGPRLLEKNVRTFLQLRGKINKGLRSTINKEPDMFLAYNNGLTVTVKSLQFSGGNGSFQEIVAAEDFQIVNGGQTTASIYHTFKKDKSDLSHVFVQAKINHVIDENITEDLTSKISMYANSQNKINAADFSSNDPYHVALEDMSRRIWAPRQQASNVETQWFYERARGQYNDELNRLNTPVQKRNWKNHHPSFQKFTKTDLAKYMNCWKQLPYMVSKGAQYNFKEFMIEINYSKNIPDEIEFKRIVAKAILFKKTDSIIKKQNYGDYKAQNAAYTMAYLCHTAETRINLDQIWKDQDITSALKEAINEISSKFFNYLLKVGARGTNVTQFCKKKDCWKEFKEQAGYKLSQDLKNELIDVSAVSPVRQEVPAEDDLKLVEWVVSLGDAFWKKVSRWGKLTKTLKPWQNSISFSIGQAIKKKGSVSVKQARQAKIIYEVAEQYGFEEINQQDHICNIIEMVANNRSSFKQVKIDILGADGKIGQKSGLNWGQREGRDPNQAYIPVRTSECPEDFFPDRGIEFDLFTDDHKAIKCVRAQDNGKAIQSLNNAELGLYFRSRLSLTSGQKVSEGHLQKYGRSDIEIYKIDDSKYYMDFSVKA